MITCSLELRPPALEAAGRATSAWEVVAIRPAQRLGSPWSLLLLRRLGLGQPLRVHRLPYIFPKNVHMSKRNASDKNIRLFKLEYSTFIPWPLSGLKSYGTENSNFLSNMKYEISECRIFLYLSCHFYQSMLYVIIVILIITTRIAAESSPLNKRDSLHEAFL